MISSHSIITLKFIILYIFDKLFFKDEYLNEEKIEKIEEFFDVYKNYKFE